MLTYIDKEYSALYTTLVCLLSWFSAWFEYQGSQSEFLKDTSITHSDIVRHFRIRKKIFFGGSTLHLTYRVMDWGEFRPVNITGPKVEFEVNHYYLTAALRAKVNLSCLSNARSKC